MAVQEKVAKLERFLSESPSFRGVPFAVVAGRAITLEEALDMLKRGVNVPEVMAALAGAGLDPLPWAECEAFYQRLAAARPELRIYGLPYVPAMSPSEALEHVRARDEVGESLAKMYANLLSFMRERMRL
jgi:hypothetical protein